MNIRSVVFSILVAVVVLALFFYECTFSVGENQLAIKLSDSGEVERADYQPGLHFTVPVVDRIHLFDKRVITHEYAEERFQINDSQIVRADYFVAWQIADVAAFYKTTLGDESVVEQRLGETIKNAVKEMMAKRNLQQVVMADRNEYSTELRNVVAADAQALGIKLLDISIHKLGLPESYNESVFTRMQNSFRQSAVQLRAQGEASAKEITAQAEHQRVEILADANRDAAITRGEGDASAAAIYAAAYGRNAEFASFYRSLQAYRTALGKADDVLVISPDSDFFKYLNKSTTR